MAGKQDLLFKLNLYQEDELNNKAIYTSEQIESIVKDMAGKTAAIECCFQEGVAIYGAGFVGTWAVSYLQSLGANVKYFIDQDPQKNGTEIKNIPVILPSNPGVSSKIPVFIAARHAVTEVAEVLKNKNITAVSFDGYYIVKNYEKFKLVQLHLSHDPVSVKTLSAILLALLTGSVNSCRSVMQKDMYFCLPEFSGTFNEIFVDAGAFVGDTIERFIWENLGTFKHIYAFEPGRKQFQALETRLSRLEREWAIDNNNVTAVRAGLAKENGQRYFSFLEDDPLRHGLTTDKNTNLSDVVPVYSLDSFLEGKEVTFLKADVEGMEMEMLQGAKTTIEKCKPKMAICVYHYPNDLIDVVQFVKKISTDYNFYLRQHAPILGDFVLYCYHP